MQFMKKQAWLLILFVISMFFTFSCRAAISGKDDDEKNGKSDPGNPGIEKKLNNYLVKIYTSLDNDKAPLTFTVEEGDTVSSISDYKNPTLDGYTFEGLFTSDNKKYDVSKPITSNLVLYAKFTKVTKSEDGNTTTKETVSADGTSVIISETITTDEAGNSSTTVTKTTTDSEGNKTTETKTDYEIEEDFSAHDLIEIGITEAMQLNITGAQWYFNAAYAKDPDNDEAKIYSALADISSIATNYKIQQFFADHFGITNYPSTLGAVVARNWLAESDYQTEDYDFFKSYTLKKVENPKANTTYYYKAKKNKGWSENTYNGFRINKYIDDNRKLNYKGKEYFLNENDYYRVKEQLQGETRGLFFIGSMEFSNSSNEWCDDLILDENGDFLVELWDYEGTAIPYQLDYEKIKYAYPVTYKAPVIKSFEKDSWFTMQASGTYYLYYLLIANIVEGNVNGLDSAIDDLYSALFESDEYKNACAKIDSIKNPVILPELAVAAFGLDEMFGSTEIQIGATELKLIKSVLEIFKGFFEYIQSYSFNISLSFLQTDWTKFIEQGEKNDKALQEYVESLIYSYNAEIDPIANGFLSVRNEEKITDSKNTYIGILADLIAAYDSITGEDSIYPSAIGGIVSEGEVFRTAAAALKEALEKDGKFYFPKEIEDIPESWPTAPSPYVYTIDCGKLFTAGQFAIDNLIELDTIKGTASTDKVPVFYTFDQNGNPVRITSADEIIPLLKVQGENKPMIAIKILALKALNEVINIEIPNLPADEIIMPIQNNVVAIIFNFYYGGLTDFLDELKHQNYN